MLKYVVTIFLYLAITSLADETKDNVRKEALENINKYLNPSANPCDNFYQYACGNWEKYNKIPEGEKLINGHLKLSANILEELKTLLEQDTPVFNGDIETKIKDFYKSCLKTDKQKSLEPLNHFFTEINGLPPLLNKEWDESKFNWMQLVSKLQSYGFDSLLGVKITSEGTDKNKIFVGEVTLPLLPSTFVDSSKKAQIDDYLEYISKTLTEKFSVEAGEAKKVASEIIEFQTQLAKGVALENTVLDKDKKYVEKTVEQLNTEYPAVEWDKFLSDVFETPITKSQAIIELQKEQGPQYLTNLFELLEKTPKSIISNFIFWSTVRQFLNVAAVPTENTWRYCVTKTKTTFPYEIGYMYSQKHYDNEVKSDIETMVEDVKKTFHEGLEKAEWVDEETKKIALNRVDSIKLSIIGYPKEQKYNADDNLLKISISADEYFKNYIELQHHIHKAYNKKLLTKTKVDELALDPTSIQLYYDIYENTVKVTLGFLNLPFYNKNLPRNMKFAQLGAVLVHEISHAVDRLGQNIDLSGKNVFWWSEKASNEFYDKSTCFSKVYEKYGVSDVTENLADNIGIKYSYLTYKKWADSIKDEKKDVFELEQFPGLDYTYSQLFFLTHAQTWCHFAQENGKVTYPVEFRINLPMWNLDEFSKEFKCPDGSAMNPKDKCTLW